MLSSVYPIRFDATIRFWISQWWLSTNTTISSWPEPVVDESDREDTDCVSGGRRLNCLAAWVKLRPLTRSVSQNKKTLCATGLRQRLDLARFHLVDAILRLHLNVSLRDVWASAPEIASSPAGLQHTPWPGPPIVAALQPSWYRGLGSDYLQPTLSISSSVLLSLFPDSP